MKAQFLLFCQLLAFSLFSQDYKYDVDALQYRMNYYGHKGDVSCSGCRYYSFSAKYPDGSDVPLCRMVNNCIFSQMLFVKKYMDQDDKLAQYQVDLQFKTLQANTDKRESKIDNQNPVGRKYYYRIPVQSVLNIKVSNKADGRIILDSTIATNSAIEFPSGEKTEILATQLMLDNYFAKNNKQLDYALLRQFLWPAIEKQAKKILSPAFEDREEEIELKFFTINTKDPEFSAFKDVHKKMTVLTALIAKANKEANHPNWHTAEISKMATELLSLMTPYLEPKYSDKIKDQRLKADFDHAIHYNVFVLQLLSASYENAAKSLLELQGIRTKLGKNFGPKKLDEGLEDLEPVLKHEKRYYQEHKGIYGYQP
jgi:hypothetical protein